MYKGRSIICVIPGRLGSTRFPRKLLASLQGKPLLQWAYEGATSCPHFDEVVVAVDCEELAEAVRGFGGRAFLTSPHCQNGTERLLELYQKKVFNKEIWVNWQGDEPFIDSSLIGSLLQSCDQEGEEIWTLKKKIEKKEEIASPHTVKVVTDSKKKALYFSRSPIPYGETEEIFKHIGIYAYSQNALEKIQHLPPSPLEKGEQLEQLRFLFHRLPLYVHETDKEIVGVNTEEDLALAEQFLICYDS